MYPGNDFPDNIYLFKVNDWNTKKKVWNMFKVNNESASLMFLLSILYK